MGLHRTFGALIPKISRNLDDVSSPKFKKIFESIYIKEKALQKAEYEDLFERYGEIPSIRFNAQAIAKFDTYTANMLQNIKSEKLRKALTELADIQIDAAKKGWDYNRNIQNLIEDAGTLDPIKDKKLIDELIKRSKEVGCQLKKISNGGFVDCNKIENNLKQLNEIALIPAQSRGEIMSVRGRVREAHKANPHLRRPERMVDFEESMKNERLRTFLNDEYGLTGATTGYNHTKEFDDFLYKEYYLKRIRSYDDVEKTLSVINDEFGTKVFLPHKTSDETADDVLREFYAWNKAGGKDVNWERTLSFDDYDTGLWNKSYHSGSMRGAAGYANPENYIVIRAEYLKVDEKYPVLRHEKMHINDLCVDFMGRCKEFGKFGKKQEYDFTEGSKILKEKIWYRDEFRKAGISEYHIDYAYTNRAEFLAVAAEGDPKAYSDEFKQVLIDLGMPDWFFGIRKFKSYNC